MNSKLFFGGKDFKPLKKRERIAGEVGWSVEISSSSNLLGASS
jgi:hypothetical protein